MLFRASTFTVLVLGACLSVVPGSASVALHKPGVIAITARQVSRYASGTRPGDVEVTRLRLFNARITKSPIGHAELVCTLIGSGTMRNCAGTFSLPRGQVVVGGTIVYREIYSLAVLGGTRIYDNVRGTLTVTALRARPPEYALVFRLVV
jgi:hypothetical protein